MSVRRVVDGVIERSGLDPKDGRPLWAYRVSATELSELGVALREVRERRSVWGRGFCLFASAHFCRNHPGGPWRWEEIFDAVLWSGPANASLYDLIERGMRFWHRPIVRTRHNRQFLGTMACEGGLPLSLLAGDREHSVASYLRDLLVTAEVYGVSATQVAADRASWLPQSFRQPGVFELAGRLVDAVVDLRRELFDEASDPLEQLDARLPEWRGSLPLVLEDDVSRELLSGLFRYVVPRALLEQVPIRVQLVLRTDGHVRFERDVRTEPEVAAALLLELLGVETLPPTFYLSLRARDGASRAFATVTQTFTGSFRVEPHAGWQPFRDARRLSGRVLLAASIGDRELALVEPPGGAEVPSDLPWALLGGPHETRSPVRAFGSAESSAQTLWLAIPAGTEVSPDPGAEVEVWSGHSPASRPLVGVRGRGTWGADDEACVFQSGVSGNEGSYELSGALRQAGFSGSEYWAGPPSVRWVRDDGARPVPTRSLHWRPRAQPGDWRSWDEDAPLGDVVIRVRRSEVTRFSVRACVLPEELELEIPVAEQGRGTLRIECPGLLGVRAEDVETELHHEARVVEAGRVEIDFECARVTRPSVRLRLLFEGGAEAVVEAPVPMRLVCFAGHEQRVLDDDPVIDLQRLGSVRAVAVSSDDGDRFSLLATPPGRTESRVVATLEPGDRHFSELSLDRVGARVDSMLSSGGRLDDFVELWLVPAGERPGPRSPRLRVMRYEATLTPRPEPESARVWLEVGERSRDALGDEAVALLRLEARPLWDPGAEPVVLERRAEGEPVWCLEGSELQNGPWLVLGRVGERCRLRPLLVTVRRGEEKFDEYPIDRSIRIGHPRKRMQALAAEVSAAAADWNHTNWTRLDGMLATVGELPAATFDVIRVVAGDPNCAAMALFRSASPRALWRGMEELPFLWAAVPVRSWLKAARAADTFYRGQAEVWASMGSSPSEEMQNVLAGPLAFLLEQAPFAPALLDVLGRSVESFPPHPEDLLDLDERLLALARKVEVARDSMVRRIRGRQPYAGRLGGLLSDSVKRLVRKLEPLVMSNDLEREDLPTLLAAPAAAAVAAYGGHRLKDAVILELKQIRAYDPRFFDVVHGLHLRRLLMVGWDPKEKCLAEF